MSYIVICPNCSQKLDSDEPCVGMNVLCPTCNKKFLVEAPSLPVSPKDKQPAQNIKTSRKNFSYIDSHLLAGEKVLSRTNIHWIYFIVWGILPVFAPLSLLYLLLAQIGAGNASTPIATVILICVLPYLFITLLQWLYTEYIVTNQRVLTKTGYFSRNVRELFLRQIEGVDIEQGIIGRLFGVASLMITGTGGTKNCLSDIKSFIEFKDAIQSQLHNQNNKSIKTDNNPSNDSEARLKKLNDLMVKGLISKEEFTEKRQEILKDI